jgi:predicted nuclease of predicted toxin-antitoxin system
MRLLIDECVDERLRVLFPGHDCQTARFANLAGLKNGILLEAAEAAGFDVLITVDQSIPDQQNLAGRRISLIILCGPTNRLRDLEPLVPAAVAALDLIGLGEVVRVSQVQ